MFSYEIFKFPIFKIDEGIVKKIFQLVDLEVNKSQKGTLNIVFVSSLEIKELNKNYRKKDYVTDVLSFHYFDDFLNLKDEEVAGELIFCEEKIIEQAKEYGLGEEKEFYKLLIHSVLHILGYDHENDNDYALMKEKEEELWKKLFIK
nr:rRNA maturation RNase YbeY [Candidatus Gracilibacteria bacterium]